MLNPGEVNEREDRGHNTNIFEDLSEIKGNIKSNTVKKRTFLKNCEWYFHTLIYQGERELEDNGVEEAGHDGGGS